MKDDLLLLAIVPTLGVAIQNLIKIIEENTNDLDDEDLLKIESAKFYDEIANILFQKLLITKGYTIEEVIDYAAENGVAAR